MKKYRLNAYGYKMVVSQDQNGKWWGFLGEKGNSAPMPAVTGPGELTETKLAVYRSAEGLAAVYGQSVVDIGTESLSLWEEFSE